MAQMNLFQTILKKEFHGEISVRGENIIPFISSYEIKELSGCKLGEKIALLRVKVNDCKRLKRYLFKETRVIRNKIELNITNLLCKLSCMFLLSLLER